MPSDEIKIHGLDELTKRLRSLPVELRKKPARSALGKAAKAIKDQAKVNAQALDDSETGRAIADNLTQRFRSKHFRRTGDLMISVGVGMDKGPIPSGNPDTGPKGNTPHWHLLELGTEKMPAQPFLRPAAETQANQAINVFADGLRKALDKLAKPKGGK